MISENDLQEAIAECEGARNPNANTCLKLAAFYTIRDQLFGKKEKESVPMISFDDAMKIFNIKSEFSHDSGIEPVSQYSSNTEFSQAIQGKDINMVLSVLDEAMDSVRMVIPRLYDSVIRRLYEL